MKHDDENRESVLPKIKTVGGFFFLSMGKIRRQSWYWWKGEMKK